MRKHLVMVLAAVAMLGAAEAAQAQGPAGGRPSFSKLLTAFDNNADNALESSEVPALVWARLSKADSNADGSVTASEFNSYPGGN